MGQVVATAALLCFATCVVYVVVLTISQLQRSRLAAQSMAAEQAVLRARLDLLLEERKVVQETRERTWSGPRKFIVKRKVRECRDVCSFYLAPHDGKPLPPFHPGQFLTFQLRIPGQSASVIRCYSLSDAPAPTCDYYRVTIKKVPPPPDKPGTPPGLVSTFFHEQVNEGDILDVKVPSGRFYLDMIARTPVVLIGGGVGITPVLSMLNGVAQSGSRRETWFFLGVRNSGEHIQKAHLEEVAAKNPNIRLHICYSDPGPDDKAGRDYHHAERVSVKLFKQLLPSNAYDFYICGPPPMMSSLTQGLKEWGVPDDNVHFEAFGPATVKAVAPAVAPAAVATTAQTFQINFARSGKALAWDQKMQSLLDFASSHGVTIDSGCRRGACGTCKVAVRDGKFSYLNPPDYSCEAGSCLTCCAVPSTDLTLDA
jgi:hypothetical protein